MPASPEPIPLPPIVTADADDGHGRPPVGEALSPAMGEFLATLCRSLELVQATVTTCRLALLRIDDSDTSEVALVLMHHVDEVLYDHTLQLKSLLPADTVPEP